MNIADPIYLEHLRDLPSGYLLDLLADNEDIDQESLHWVLKERGITQDEIDRKVHLRQKSTWARPYRIWAIGRVLAIFNTFIISYFNTTGLYLLVKSDHAFRGTLIFLSVGCLIFGFFVGYKLTTHLYQGGKSLLHCGFPIPVGVVDLKTGQEIFLGKKTGILRMALNAIVGVNLTLFPLVFLYTMMS